VTLKGNKNEVGAVDLWPVCRLLNLREVASCLGVCVRTVQRLIDKGELSSVRLGAAVRVFESDLANYLAKLREAFPTGPALGAPSREPRSGPARGPRRRG
jgi:excisionase family DNA binding protein